MKNYDLAVIGAGPAGIMAAIIAARNGKKVLLLEKNENIGRKILATGNGRCNLTNQNVTVDRYHGAKPEFIQNIIERFDQFQTMEFFESLVVVLKEEELGRIFPRTNQATTIVEALRHALIENNVFIETGVTVKSIEIDNHFSLAVENGGTFQADKVVLATGGKAAFQFGSSGDGLFWAKKLGHNIIPVYAALVPIETEEDWVQEVQGIKIVAKITSKMGNEVLKETTGDALFTHFGISGPAVMAHAGTISPLIDTNRINIFIDLYPEMEETELNNKVEQIFLNNSKKNLKNALIGLFPAGLVPVILDQAQVDASKNAAEVSKAERSRIVKTIKNLPLTVKKIRPLKEAQVSRGGIDTTEIDPDTLKSKLVDGLYFAGEIMDVDGDSGGFNLQWAWSSGFVSGNLR